jgi:predicted DCC family thiol-disulfide oxidoreductase YuxK
MIPPVALIYDADCPACRAAADWVRRNAVVPDAFDFLPCRSAETRSRFPAIAEAACLQAMHLVLPDGAILAGEKALPEILRRTRRYRRTAILFRLPGAGILSRFLYRAFARRRHRISRLFPPG